MIRQTTASTPPSTRARCWFVGAVALSLLSLTACATPTGAATPTPRATPSATASVSPIPTPSPTDTPSPTSTPFNGQVLIVTADVLDGQLQVTAMVPGVSEGNGTCTLEIVDAAAQPVPGSSVSVTGAEGKDVTYCGLMAVPTQTPLDQLAFRVRYDSPSTRTASAVSSVEPAP